MTRFAGQWIGKYEGTNEGLALLDLDDRDGLLEGNLYAFEASTELPSTLVPVTVAPQKDTLEFDGAAFSIHPKLPQLIGDPSEYPGTTLPKKMKASLSLKGDTIVGNWETDVPTSGTANLFRSQANSLSRYSDQGGSTDWDQFQKLMAEHVDDPYRFIFRGQSSPWRLRTSFHRTQRKDLWRYWNEDIPRVRHAALGHTNFLFDPNVPDHNGAFMHLLQHHGYPTPMLDWTYSPYIAAFFAYASAPPGSLPDNKVRIFMFDAKKWKEDYPQLLHVTLCRPHFSLIEPLAIGNSRALPQQSVAAITNVDDVEAYVEFKEAESGNKYLSVFDLPTDDRGAILRQLGLMGISPGSMFPGIEGVCREYRDRHFGY